MVKIEPSWGEILKDEFEKEYFLKLIQFVKTEYSSYVCYPPGNLIFNAFWQTPIDRIKVVILGQDPYHGPGQAQGLCFTVPEGIQYPPSLVNIFKEIASEYPDRNITAPEGGWGPFWAQQGVFLLNTCLSVRQHQAFSHSNQGWEIFTDSVIKAISDNCDGVVFLLWGAPAGRKARLIDSGRHYILTSAHPSPLSAYRGFFGNNHFRKCNEYLAQQGKEPIVW